MDEPDFLVTRRSKRSTAGNRMEAVMASELAQLESRTANTPQAGAEPENQDVDFEFNDEKDVFESDFETTDEEEGNEEHDSIAERYVQEEERRMMRRPKTKLERVTALAHKHQRATFKPELYKALAPRPTPSDRRTRPAVIVDPETGEVTEPNKRKSQRTSTMLKRAATISKLLQDANQRSKTVKRPKTQRSAPTQDELLKRAQEMEERNVIEHRDYLKTEDEKRQRARLVRPTIEGRLVRWVSKVEEEIIPIAPPESMMSGAITSHGYTTPLRSSTPYMTPFYTTDPGPPLHWSNSTAAPGPSSPSAYTSAYPHPPTLQYSPSPSRPHISSTSSATRPLEPLPTIVQRKQKIAKNYVVLENAQTEKAPRVTWKQTMEGMFGDHVRWEDMRVYSTKNRPLSRPRERCPITGLAANYLDPQTGVPYANVFAYKEIKKILEHEYVWNGEFGCYVGQEEVMSDEDEMQDEAR